jgi:type II secretory pathway component PulC
MINIHIQTHIFIFIIYICIYKVLDNIYIYILLNTFCRQNKQLISREGRYVRNKRKKNNSDISTIQNEKAPRNIYRA